MTKLTVVAAIAAIDSITLYLVDGSTKELKTNEYRTVDIIEKVLPNAALGKPTEIILKEYGIQADFEKNTNNTISFYVVEKKLTESIFTNDIKVDDITPEFVMQNGGKNFSNMNESETTVAIVDGKVIPGMENIEAQLQRANETNSVGMVNFLKRIAKVIDKRGHSVEDLLKFLKGADLPIAEDGSVIAYKLLIKEKDYFLDCYSRKVKQRVGDFVFMKETMVNPDRRQSCSNGLHIARRDYLAGFGGDVIVICKINPEDFIAVPEYDSSKVRVSGYHILSVLDKKAYKLLKNNTPMTANNPTAVLLSNILAGNHINIVNRVEITGPRGSGLKTTKVAKAIKPKKTKRKKTKAIEPIEKKAKEKIAAISPKAIREKMNEIIKKDKTPNELQATAIALFKLGKNKTQIAQELGSSTRTIGRWFDKFSHLIDEEEITNLKKTTKTKAKKPSKDWEPDAPKPKKAPVKKAKKIYGETPQQRKAFNLLTQGKTKAQAAKTVGTSTRTLGRWIEKYNFKLPK